ncbi:MAG: glycosyltransferase family 2 protein [Lachnospiraceae bacterium]|nr:glycosyltransferase family 2 protein [Lachnospiraceae bacterium]
MDTLYIVMPAYNEEANILGVIDSWYGILEGKSPESRLVVADAGSQDATHNILLRFQKTHPQLEILEKTDRQHGPKVIALYDYAIKNGADYIFQTDSDGQTNPKEFSAFWEERRDFDGVFGNRTERGDGKFRSFTEKVVCFLLRLYFKVKVPDANAPFRLMKASVVEKYLSRFDKDYNLPNIMMTTFFSYYKERTLFKEISFKPRRAGKNSVNIPRIIKIGFKALGDFRRFKKGMK